MGPVVYYVCERLVSTPEGGGIPGGPKSPLTLAPRGRVEISISCAGEFQAKKSVLPSYAKSYFGGQRKGGIVQA